jgi:hypothetical protein
MHTVDVLLDARPHSFGGRMKALQRLFSHLLALGPLWPLGSGRRAPAA